MSSAVVKEDERQVDVDVGLGSQVGTSRAQPDALLGSWRVVGERREGEFGFDREGRREESDLERDDRENAMDDWHLGVGVLIREF